MMMLAMMMAMMVTLTTLVDGNHGYQDKQPEMCKLAQVCCLACSHQAYITMTSHRRSGWGAQCGSPHPLVFIVEMLFTVIELAAKC